MADLASALKPDAVSKLRGGLKDKDSGVRYWAELGLWMRGSNAVNSARSELRALLADESPSVRTIAAQSLVRFGSPRESTPALATLAQLAPPEKNGVFVSVEALTAIETLGPRAQSLFPELRTMSREDPNATPRSARYAGEFLDHLLSEEPR